MPVTPEDLESSLTLQQAADTIHVTYRTMQRIVAANQIDVVRVGNGRGRPRITRRALTDYLNRQQSRSGAAS